MTVKELKALLENIDDNHEVYVSTGCCQNKPRAVSERQLITGVSHISWERLDKKPPFDVLLIEAAAAMYEGLDDFYQQYEKNVVIPKIIEAIENSLNE
jgi:hypothetical protein